jgi:hypothetical protein
MLEYVHDIAFPEDDLLERARRTELYRAQAERFQQLMQDQRFRQGPYAQPVYCAQLKDQFPSGFATLRAAAKFIGTKRSHLRTAIRLGRRCKGYLFVYQEGGQRVRIRTGRERPVLCLNDGMVKESVTEAARYGGISTSALCMALREAQGLPAACGGRLWQYVQGEQRVQLYLFDAAPRCVKRICIRRARESHQPQVIQPFLFEELVGSVHREEEDGKRSANRGRGQPASAA